jgi:DNA invertase Pin-like site-specific DNA recombinase
MGLTWENSGMKIDRRAAIALRLSEDPYKGTDREGEGIARQGEDCDFHAERNGWPVSYRLVDNDSTALRRRPGFEELLKLVKSGDVNVVIAWSGERLLKTKRDEYRFYETCLNAPSPVIVSFARGMTFDLSTPQGRKFFDNAASDARYETELKSERQRRANRQHAEQGRPAPGPRPFGYEADRVTLRRAESDAGKAAYRSILAGGGLAAQVRRLNAAGLVTGQGNLWRTETLRKWLLSSRNAGLRSHRGEIIGQGNWSGLVDVATWRAVKAILESQSRKKKVGKSAMALLTGIARCGVCGETVNMSGGGGRSNGNKNYTCRLGSHVSRTVTPVDDLVTELAIAIIERDGPDLLVDDERPDLEALYEQEAAARTRLKQLGEDYALELIERSTMLAGTEAARAKIAEIQTKITDAGRVDILGDAVAADDVWQWWHSEEVTNDRRRRIIDTLMDVTILRAVRGRKAFDPTTVRLTPKKVGRSRPPA